MSALQQLFREETSYFKKLHQDARQLLISIFLYNLISPLIGIFLTAFLWRESHSLLLVASYNVIYFLVIPLGFYLNGWLLRRYQPALPFTLSLLATGGAIAVLTFLPTISYTTIIIFGIVNGVSAGVYWANRNLLTLQATQSDDRIYFSSLESSSGNLTDVVIPLLIGGFIALGATLHIYSSAQGYQILVLLMVGIIIAIGAVSRKISIKKPSLDKLFLKQISRKWKTFRWLEFILGLKEATVTFIPPLLVLILVGQEGTLGAIRSASTILAGLFVYILGKSLKTHHRLRLILISIIITVLGGIVFGITYSAIGVFIFFACQALAEPFVWVGLSSINYDLIDQDNKDPKLHYAYVCDQEVYLNGGRVVGIVLFIVLLSLSSNEFALRFAPFIFGATQILLLITARSIEKKHERVTIPS